MIHIDSLQGLQNVDFEGIPIDSLWNTGFQKEQKVHKIHSYPAKFHILNKKGATLFVIGSTEYKGVRIDNAKHLSESLFTAGFSRLSITKRKISNKILTPYGDEDGKFTSDKSGRKIYSEEFITVGEKGR